MPIRFHQLDGADYIEVWSPNDPQTKGDRPVRDQDKRFWSNEWVAYQDSLKEPEPTLLTPTTPTKAKRVKTAKKKDAANA